MKNTYRILEAHKSRPELEYTLEEALNEIAPYSVGAVLKVERGMLHLEGTAFYLQQVGGLVSEVPDPDFGWTNEITNNGNAADCAADCCC